VVEGRIVARTFVFYVALIGNIGKKDILVDAGSVGEKMLFTMI
jgi:hypothetical protein